MKLLLQELIDSHLTAGIGTPLELGNVTIPVWKTLTIPKEFRGKNGWNLYLYNEDGLHEDGTGQLTLDRYRPNAPIEGNWDYPRQVQKYMY